MVELARQGIVVAQLPCLLGDTEPRVLRLPDVAADSGWGLWILSDVDLRMTARVRVFRDFMVEALEPCVPLIEGAHPTAEEREWIA